jgi:small subunit ribosomal protein S15
MISKKKELIDKVRLHQIDCGSSLVQIASLSFDIDNLTEHLKKFNKDIHSRRGLTRKINTRKKLLNYIKNRDDDRYQYIINLLNIRK